MEILSENHTKPIAPKYATVILQVATLEERIRSLMSFGLVEESKKLSEALVMLLQEIRDEYVRDNGDDKKDKDDSTNDS